MNQEAIYINLMMTYLDNLTYEEMPVEILDRQVRRLRNKKVASMKVL